MDLVDSSIQEPESTGQDSSQPSFKRIRTTHDSHCVKPTADLALRQCSSLLTAPGRHLAALKLKHSSE